MSYRVRDAAQALEALAPLFLAEEWDNCGLLIGSAEAALTRVSFALDMDAAAVERTLAFGSELLIVHHPPIFTGIKHLNEEVPEMRNINRLIRAGVAVYAAHTNLDAAVGGVNDCLAAVLGLKPEGTLFPAARQGGELADERLPAGLVRLAAPDEAMPFEDFLRLANRQLRTSGCFMSGLDPRPIRRVALSGGACDEAWTEALAESGVDLLLAGEIKHHQLLALEARGVRALACGHDCTERPVLAPLAAYLEGKLPGLSCEVYTGLDYDLLF